MSKTGWRFFLYYTLITILVIAGVFLYVPDQLLQNEEKHQETRMLAEAQLIADSLPLLAAAPEELPVWLDTWSTQTGAQIVLITTQGAEWPSDAQQTEAAGQLIRRPEVQQALETGHGFFLDSIEGGGTTADTAMAAYLAPSFQVVVHLSTPFQSVTPWLQRSLLIMALVAIGLGALAALLVDRHLIGYVRRLTEVSRRLSAGDSRARVIPSGHDEFTGLFVAFNAMADEFESRLRTMTRQRDEQAAVLEYMADGVLIVDGGGRVQLINGAGARLLKLDKAAIIGQSFAQVVRDYQLIELWHNSHDRGTERIATLNVSHLGLFVRAIITPLEAGEAPRCLVMIQDLTQLRWLENVRRDFVSNISHELRTPLASLKAVIETLRGGALEDTFATQHFLDRAETEVDDMTQIVQELLELARVESGKAPLRIAPVSVQEILVTPVERLQPQAERAGLSLKIELPPELPHVSADGERIQQVVTNLVHNAIKFTEPEGQITVSAEAVGDNVIFAVADTGVGIPAEDVPRIFERFYKADRARSGGGTGLGLAIAKHIVEAHGGHIWVDSVEGKGSTFYFSLPIVG